jgi:uncharacterized repeat protein (TIGR03803 family)
MDSVILANGAAKLDPVDSNDLPSGGTSVDPMVVGVATGDFSAQFAVGLPDLAAGTGSGDMALASAVAANKFLRIASGYTAGSASATDTTSGTTVPSGGAAGSAGNTASGSDSGGGALGYEAPPDQAPAGQTVTAGIAFTATDTAGASATDSPTGVTTTMTPTLITLLSFDGTDGWLPEAGLITDAAGDLFGTTLQGGVYADGAVFELVNNGGGSYASTPTELIRLTSGGSNGTGGTNPVGGLIADAAGNLFGTTSKGGALGNGGTLFEIPYINGSYSGTPIILVSFDNVHLNSTQGVTPDSGLIVDAAGDLFGTTLQGGATGDGTVFELPFVNGSYPSTPTTLVSFNVADGSFPQAGLIADAKGDFFGTTPQGGASNAGTVFEIPSFGGGIITLVSFTPTNGPGAAAGLIMDAAGDLFGTTYAGGANSYGTVFEIAKTSTGYASTPTTLVSFDGTNGATPEAGLIIDAAGNLFGTTSGGGTYNEGTVFEIPLVSGSYVSPPTTLVSFNVANGDGAYPAAALTADAAGNLFGTTEQGGANGDGTVFEVTDSGFVVACYCRGTLILTAGGEVPVEELAIGDRVVTISGAARPIKWIGRRGYAGRFAFGQKHLLPVCIKTGALADSEPRRDLWVSPNHALYLEGVLIEARDLVNGVSIVQAERVAAVEYFHIELDSHDVIVAEGAAAESFIDDDSRGLFHNAHEYRALYANAAAGPARYCAPRRDQGCEVERARAAIARRAGIAATAEAPALGLLRGQIEEVGWRRICGWAQDAAYPEAPVCLDILAGGELIGQVVANTYRADLAAAGLGSFRHGFEFMPPAGLVFTPRSIEVRRSLDGARLTCPTDLKQSPARGAARGPRHASAG